MQELLWSDLDRAAPSIGSAYGAPRIGYFTSLPALAMKSKAVVRLRRRGKSMIGRLGHRLALVSSLLLMPVAGKPAPAPPAKAAAGEVIPIWPGPPPGTEDWPGSERVEMIPVPTGETVPLVTDVTIPTLTVFRPASGGANGTAMIVAPGGGFQILAIDTEGKMVARWLAGRGITAFLLKYRVRMHPEIGAPGAGRADFDAREQMLRPFKDIAFADGQQAVRFLRRNAARYGIAPDRIGMIGFSAGAMTVMGTVLAADPAARPDFAAPIYGAMDPVQVPPDAPPLFIAAAQNDELVPVAKSVG
jgi:acetyl esterase/lipase